MLGNIVALNLLNQKIDNFAETAVLIDFVFLIPCIYIWCFRSDLKRALIKSIAIASLGFWGASILIPEPQQIIIQEYRILRYLGLAVLFLLEIKIALIIWRSIFKGKSKQQTIEDISADSDIPVWVARLMAWEASLWKKLIDKFKKT